MGELSFKSRLDDFKKIVAAENDDGWKAFDLAVLDRWQEHAFVNDGWTAIQKAATRDGERPLWPGDLVEWVIDRAREQKRLVEDVVPKSAALERKVILESEKNWREARKGNGDLALLAGVRSRAAQQHKVERLRVLGRQPNPRKMFILSCRQFLLINCGQPLDAVVEMLLFVVSGIGAKDNEVRDALKASTREGRDTKKQK
jgi:hypothetical protein